MCSRTCARTVLLVVNFLFVLLGLATTIVGIYAHSMAHKFGSDVIPREWVNMFIATGVLVFVLAFAGCCGALKDAKGIWRFVLMLYSVGLFVLIVLQVAGAVMLLHWMGQIEGFKGHRSAELMSSAERKFNNALNDTYIECCESQNEETSLCKLLHDVTTHDCGNFTLFKDSVINFLHSKFRPASVAVLSFGIVQVFCLISACYIFCSNPKDDDDEDDRRYLRAEGGVRMYYSDRVGGGKRSRHAR